MVTERKMAVGRLGGIDRDDVVLEAEFEIGAGAIRGCRAIVAGPVRDGRAPEDGGARATWTSKRV